LARHIWPSSACPEILISYGAVPFYFGAPRCSSLVSVTMDTVAQVQVICWPASPR